MNPLYPLSVDELSQLLNQLLEAERAGARTLAAFLDEYTPQSPEWQELRRVQHDEASNCKLLIDALHSLGAAPSGATGDFLGKALAVQGQAARLVFLNRGQGWVARKIGEALPRIGPGPVREMLQQMHESHMANIAACAVLLDEPTERSTPSP